MIRLKPTHLAVALIGLFGCAHYPENPPLKSYDPNVGYRFGNDAATADDDGLFIVLCFSGGGTRAAALSYGVLERLHDTPNPADPQCRPLLDQVDVISSVSGGSFTAAYYGLYGERIFDDFRRRCLTRDLQGDMLLRVLNPLNWPRLMSPYFSRVDIAAETFDDELFDHHTFGDLAAARHRPFVILNSTDMSLGSRFEFTQDQFDLLGSNLSEVDIARGVAASAAFPVLLAPVTITNHADRPVYTPPLWYTNALDDREANPWRYQHARQVRTYLQPDKKPFVHLIDGGISDNVAMRGIWQAFESPDRLTPKSLDIQAMVNNRRIKKLVIIDVNAQPADEHSRDRSAATPGILDVVLNVSNMPMENFSFDTVQMMRDAVQQQQRDHTRLDPKSPWATLRTYFVEVSFDAVPDTGERRYLEHVGTNFHLSIEAVDRLRSAGSHVLSDSTDFRRLLTDLRSNSAGTATVQSRPSPRLAAGDDRE